MVVVGDARMGVYRLFLRMVFCRYDHALLLEGSASLRSMILLSSDFATRLDGRWSLVPVAVASFVDLTMFLESDDVSFFSVLMLSCTFCRSCFCRKRRWLVLRLKQPGFDRTVLTHDDALLMKLTRFSPALTPEEGDGYFKVIICLVSLLT